MTPLHITVTITDEAIPEFTRQERWPLVMDPVCAGATLFYLNPNTLTLNRSPVHESDSIRYSSAPAPTRSHGDAHHD